MWIKNSRQYREVLSQKISWGHWFAFFNTLLAIAIGSRYAFLIDWPHTLFGKIYFFISILGHFSFVVFAVYLLLLFPFSFIIKNERTFRGISVIIATLSLSLLLVDTEVFARFNLHLSSVVWNLLVNPDNGELSRSWQIFFAPMPLILLIQMLYSRWSWYKLRSLERQKWLLHVGFSFVAMFVLTHLIYMWADATIYRPITMQRSNFPLSYPMTARSFLEKNGFLDKVEYEETLNQEGRAEALNIDYPKNPLHFASIAQKPNILFITVSGLRYDAVNTENMPALTEFAAQSTEFTNHYSSGNSNNAGLAGLFYGLNANYTDSLLNDKQSSVLIEKLQQENYQFGLFSATGFKSSLFKQTLFANIKGLKGENSNKRAVENFHVFLANQQGKQPWFSYLDLDLNMAMQDVHKRDLAQQQQYYQQQLGLLDQQLAPIWRELHEKQQLEQTIVILTAEQGYSFQQDQAQLHNFTRDEIQVPLIIHWDQLAKGKNHKLTSHVDLLPTLMKSVFKVENPNSDYAQGESLLNTQRQANWVFASNFRWNVIIMPDGSQYHIDNKGKYVHYDANYQVQSQGRPPLGLFLEVFTQGRSFIAK